MSALSLPPKPHTTARPDLRLVEAPPRSSLAPSGPLQAWRRRVGLLLVVVTMATLAVQALAQGPTAAPEVVPVSTATVVVQPGQTLWDVAAEHAPDDTSPAAYVHELAELNGITNGAVDAWQVLRLPDA